VGDKLPVKARLVRANNQWGMKKTPLIKVSLYVEDVFCYTNIYNDFRKGDVYFIALSHFCIGFYPHEYECIKGIGGEKS